VETEELIGKCKSSRRRQNVNNLTDDA